MNRENVTLRLVQPCEHQQVLAGLDPVERGQEIRLDLNPGIGRSLEALLGRIGGPPQRRTHPPDRPQ